MMEVIHTFERALKVKLVSVIKLCSDTKEMKCAKGMFYEFIDLENSLRQHVERSTRGNWEFLIMCRN